MAAKLKQPGPRQHKRIAKALDINDVMNAQSMMWYFISWNEKLTNYPFKWSYNKRKKVALDISKFLSGVPAWQPGISVKEANGVIESENVKYLEAVPSEKPLRVGQTIRYVLKDTDGTKIASMSGQKLIALFYYLVDSLYPLGFEGIEWIDMAKRIIDFEDGTKKKAKK